MLVLKISILKLVKNMLIDTLLLYFFDFLVTTVQFCTFIEYISSKQKAKHAYKK